MIFHFSIVQSGFLTGNLSDLTVASSQFDILFCSETLVSDMRHVSELLVKWTTISGCLVVSGQDASGHVGWRHTYEMVYEMVLQLGAVSGARFLTGGVFKYDIANRRSVPVLCMLYKIRCNPLHPLNGALPGPYVPVRVTRCALVGHRYTYAPPRCRTSQYSRTFISLSVSLWNVLANPVSDGVGLVGFKSRANALLLA